MTVDYRIYDQKFFANTIKLESSTAKAVVKILIKNFKPKTVIDIGCGAGIYLREFQRAKVKILGYDGSPAARATSSVGSKIKLHDLCQPLGLKKKFDLCLCLEVAEHLPANCANILLKSLTNLSNVIVFTAATLGQGPISIGHINEQPHQYWINKFKKYQFNLEKNLTRNLRKEMEKKKVVWWISKNLMIFIKNEQEKI